MPAITPDEVRHVARLARLELSEEEVARFTRQLGEILQAARRLQELDTEGVDPTFYPLPLRNVFRPDEVRPSLPRERVLQNAPEVEADMFRVPRIIEEA
ncbi:Asp-tRNA(Asn)/Glu-tRNA(Gln) amidotransferase subunit GatC [Geochorda subterranea]|uniref:Aspartyl/glutamyl-tRNA(Asn/Gln) amidotransferase subunit C n=1 Tax=Geochorda subterranea TaxID=3109564 RepID=A0ABZ1BSF6_9FIRM|nr:Asp-tRNA(Asn)/Glu-tRNA(Gln) amidotransferase subunit GatC [Limnochorda sp. LNt]WRP15410.1 Asp-tRNA(Asn)/Glu-tRNA(Gln) amidotransferase subunit GatC [Limnochorda sp. LNt]